MYRVSQKSWRGESFTRCITDSFHRGRHSDDDGVILRLVVQSQSEGLEYSFS